MDTMTLDLDVSALQDLLPDEQAALDELAGGELMRCQTTCETTCIFTCWLTWW